MNFTKFIYISSLSGILLTTLPAYATYIYVNGWGMQRSVQSCIDHGKRVAKDLKFKLDEDTIWDDASKSSGALYATYKGYTDISLNYRCDGNTGVVSFGISGSSNDNTYNLYSDFFDRL